jgi:hypothetical protein
MYNKVVVIPEQNFNFWLQNKAIIGSGTQQTTVTETDTTSK